MTLPKDIDVMNLVRMVDEVQEHEGDPPDHVFIDDNGKRVFVECERCGDYIKVWSNDFERKRSARAFAEEHWECDRERFIPMEGEDNGDPYFADDNDRCPPMGLQEAVIR